MSLPKPKLGESCNGCGLCCLAEPCHLAVEILGKDDGICPALEYDDGRYYCGIVRRPAWYMFGENAPESETAPLSVLFATAIGFGKGCDSENA